MLSNWFKSTDNPPTDNQPTNNPPTDDSQPLQQNEPETESTPIPDTTPTESSDQPTQPAQDTQSDTVMTSVSSFFGSFANTVKAKIEENNQKFLEEKEKYNTKAQDNTNKGDKTDPLNAPWMGISDDEKVTHRIRASILDLGIDTVTLSLPLDESIGFAFDMDTYYEDAMSALAADPNLEQTRFQLVPKHISEDEFWRGYFYNVSLIYQRENERQRKEPSSGASTSRLDFSNTGYSILDNNLPDFLSDSYHYGKQSHFEDDQGVSGANGNGWNNDFHDGLDQLSSSSPNSRLDDDAGLTGLTGHDDDAIKSIVDDFEEELRRELDGLGLKSEVEGGNGMDGGDDDDDELVVDFTQLDDGNGKDGNGELDGSTLDWEEEFNAEMDLLGLNPDDLDDL
eukprot:TRINITY_DN1191_c0_g1_i5.p1 TRINITY_DN1191_c0_g1~~TRINITY_DN1191_c0_g1_i5.p1  ORF type:complete len:396 (-),score=128.22 TRINITY_DN1191_c0_g1_i5:122-1309(-)